VSTNGFEAGAVTPNPPDNPLSLPLADFIRDLNINTTSAFVAAQQAALAFEQLPDSASRTFIYTGNALNTTTMAPLLDLGVGKSATAHIIQSAAAAYKDKGYKYAVPSDISLIQILTVVDSTMATSGRLMVLLHSRLMEKHMENSTWSSPKESHKARGSRRL
jgi:hypothetical protein